MSARKIIAIIVLAVVVAVGGALAYLMTLDVGQYRGVIAERAKEATGRDLTIAGEMDLKIGWSPAVVLEDVTFGNAAWGSRPEMAKLKRLEAQVELIPLFTGDIRVVKLILIEPDILLETDKQGRGNWVLAAEKAAAEAEKAEAVPAEEAPKIPEITEVRIQNGRLVYLDGVTGARQEVSLAKFEAEAKSFSAPLDIEIEGRHNEMSFEVEGRVGPLADLAATGRSFPVSLRAELGGMPKFSLAADVTREEKSVALANLKFTAGSSDIGGNVTAVMGRRTSIKADLASTRLDLTEWMPPSGEKAAPEAPKAKEGAKGDKVFPQEPLPLEGLKAVDADVSLTVKEVLAPKVTMRDIKLGLKLTGGKLVAEPLSFNVADSAVTGRIGLDASRATPRLEAKIDSPELDIGKLLVEAGMTDLLEGKAAIGVDLKGQGASVAKIMGSLDGQTKILMGNGRARTEAFDYMISGASKVMGTLFTGKEEWTVLNCVANNFDIRQGIATSKVMLVDTEYSTVIGEGNVDLGEERLNLKVSPQAKSVTLSVAVPVKIGGTLANPTFSPDELAAARKLGGLLGIAIFPPAAIAGLGEMGGGEDNPCLKILSGEGQAAPRPEPTSPLEEAPKKVLEGVGEGVKGVGEGLKKLFGN